MKEYVKGFDPKTYEFTTPDGTVVSPKKTGSGNVIDAFVKAAEQAESGLGCLVEACGERNMSEFMIVRPDHPQHAKLMVNYGGPNGYNAKIVLMTKTGQVQVSVDRNNETAIKQILKFLRNPDGVKKKKKTTKHFIVDPLDQVQDDLKSLGSGRFQRVDFEEEYDQDSDQSEYT